MRPRLVPFGQGLFYLAGGLWPIVHLRSFEAFTGPKLETWMVKAIGGMLAVIGATLLVGAYGKRTRAEQILGTGSAAALAGVDLVYASRGRISKIYLVDAAAQLAVLSANIAVA